MEKTIRLIPGWMNSKGMYGDAFPLLEVWKERLHPENCNCEAHIIIAQSLGCHWALLNLKEKKDTKLILVNPLVPRRSILIWLWRFITFQLFDNKAKKEIVRGIGQLLFGMKLCYYMLRRDVMEIAKNFPKENLLVLKGTKDKYFCDELAYQSLVKYGIRVEVVEGRHDWEERYTEVIQAIIEKW